MRVGSATRGSTACSHTSVTTEASLFAAYGDSSANSAGDQPVAPLAVPLLKILAKRVSSAPLSGSPAGSRRAACRSSTNSAHCRSRASVSLHHLACQEPLSFASTSLGSPSAPSR